MSGKARPAWSASACLGWLMSAMHFSGDAFFRGPSASVLCTVLINVHRVQPTFHSCHRLYRTNDRSTFWCSTWTPADGTSSLHRSIPSYRPTARTSAWLALVRPRQLRVGSRSPDEQYTQRPTLTSHATISGFSACGRAGSASKQQARRERRGHWRTHRSSHPFAGGDSSFPVFVQQHLCKTHLP